MGKSAIFDEELLGLIFNGTAISNLADNAASSPITNLYVALHTASPTTAGNQTSSEANYTGYARVAVARTSDGWVINGTSLSPLSTIVFPSCSGGSNAITHWSVGTASSGTGKILYFGTVSPNITITTGLLPQLTTASTITES